MGDQASHGRSKAGVELTGDVLDEMSKEAEDGLDTSKLRRRPHPTSPARHFVAISRSAEDCPLDPAGPTP